MRFSRYNPGGKLLFAAVSLMILRYPLYQIAFEAADFVLTWQGELYLLLVLVLGGLWGELPADLKSNYARAISLALLSGLLLLPVWLLNWPLLFFIPVILLLILLSLRQQFYSRQVDFSAESLRLQLLYLLALLLAGYLELSVNPVEILVFLLLLFFLQAAYSPEKSQEDKGERTWQPALLLFTASLLLSLLLGILFNLPLRAQIQTAVNFLLQAWNRLMSALAYLIGLLVYPVLLLAERLIDLVREREIMGEFIGEVVGEPEVLEFQEEAVSQLEATGIGRLILTIIIVAVIFLLIRRILRGRGEEDKGYTENRESLQAGPLLKKNAAEFIDRLREGFRERFGRPDYNLEDPVERIRYQYYQFLQLAQKYSYKNPGDSPRKYFTSLLEQENWQKTADLLEEFTVLYEQARYAGRASREEAEQAEKIREKLSRAAGSNNSS